MSEIVCGFDLLLRKIDANTNAHAVYFDLQITGPHEYGETWTLPTPGTNPSTVSVFGVADGGPAPQSDFALAIPQDNVWTRYIFALVANPDGGANHTTVSRDGIVRMDANASPMPTDNTGFDLTLGFGFATVYNGGAEILIDNVACDTK